MLRVLLAMAIAASAGEAANATEQAVKLDYSPWIKSCRSGSSGCLTASAGRLPGGDSAGKPVVLSLALLERSGDNRRVLRALLPLGMQLKNGISAIIEGKSLEKSPYVRCASDGCVSDLVVDDDVLRKLRGSKEIVVKAINSNGAPVSFAIPLSDLGKALDGEARNWRALETQDRKRMGVLLTIGDDANQADATAVLEYSAWKKVCSKVQDKEMCVTGAEAKPSSAGTHVGAMLITLAETKILRIAVPLGQKMSAQPEVAVDGRPSSTAPYVACLEKGCIADFALTAAAISDLERGTNLVLRTGDTSSEVVTRTIPLDGFKEVFNGPPFDPSAPQPKAPKNVLGEPMRR